MRLSSEDVHSGWPTTLCRASAFWICRNWDGAITGNGVEPRHRRIRLRLVGARSDVGCQESATRTPTLYGRGAPLRKFV